MQTKHQPTTIQNAINYTKTNVNRVKKYCILHVINREMKIMGVGVMKKKKSGENKKDFILILFLYNFIYLFNNRNDTQKLRKIKIKTIYPIS